MSVQYTLSQIDMTQPAIKAGAGAMMKHYDRSADTAVTEWRNALQSCREDQLLPLLYVANEVLQNSKRNRGNKFLEAFSTALGQALQYICQRAPDLVEKVRRTVKIWGDRRVFSVRFVGELLKGLEPYRNGGQPPPAIVAEQQQTLSRFSPTQPEVMESPKPQDPPPAAPTEDDSRAEVTASPTAEDLMRQSSDDDDTDDDDDLGFGSGEGGAQLDVTFDASKLGEVTTPTTKKRPGMKRRRSSGGKRRKSILSTQSLQDLWNQLSSLQQQYDQSQTLLRGIDGDHLQEDNVSELIGDQVLDAYQKNQHYTKLVKTERANLHRVANSKRSLEQEAVRYLPWCNTALLQDDEDLELCNAVEEELLQLRTIHAAAKKVRDKRRALQEEAERRQHLEQMRQQEEEERKKLLEASLAKQEEAQPGMVWNKATQEYVYLNTEEEWRD